MIALKFSRMNTLYQQNYRKLVGWLSAERRSQKLSQTQLAQKVGWETASYISKIETFERVLGITEYISIAIALDLDPKDGVELMMLGLNNKK